MWRKTLSLILPTLVLCAVSAHVSGAANAQARGLLRVPRTLVAKSGSTGLTKPRQKRFIMLRHSNTPDGTRVTFTSDQLLADYNSYAEGERLYVLIPQASLIGAKSAPSGRGFANMQIEQHGDDVLLSFILQQGATVNFSQRFNRLDVLFMTNEQANKVAVHSPGVNRPHLDDLEVRAFDSLQCAQLRIAPA